MEFFSFSLLAVLIGARHGIDADHVAAIADMVGTENRKKQQVKLGLMYALGHGFIVLIMGMVAIFFGTQLAGPVLTIIETAVGVSLILLGGGILYSILQKKNNYQYKSRLSLVWETILKMMKKNNPQDQLSPLRLGAFGAIIVGIVHGIGVETPTQIMIIAGAVGLNDVVASTLQLLLFIFGLLISTTMITICVSWGFMKSKNRQKVFVALGSLTGIYSVWLGFSIIYSI
jgi:high-affinity nickel permease